LHEQPANWRESDIAVYSAQETDLAGAIFLVLRKLVTREALSLRCSFARPSGQITARIIRGMMDEARSSGVALSHYITHAYVCPSVRLELSGSRKIALCNDLSAFA